MLVSSVAAHVVEDVMASSQELTISVRFLMYMPAFGPLRARWPVAHWSITREVTRGCRDLARIWVLVDEVALGLILVQLV